MIMVYFRTHLDFSAVELSCSVLRLSELTDKMFVHNVILARLVRYISAISTSSDVLFSA